MSGPRSLGSRSGRSATPAQTSGRATRNADRTFLEFVLDQLHGLGDLKSRAMFGGHGLYQGPVFFAIVHRGRLYFRVDDVTRPNYEARGMGPFRPGSRQTLGRYYEVPADVLEDAIESPRWARAAVAVAVGVAPKARARR